MGQLRSAVRALASTGLGPGPLLDALDRVSHRHSVGEMTTLAYAEVDVAARRVRYACAGHPPPVVVEEGAAPRFAWDGRSTPLDAYGGSGSHPRAEGTLELAARSTLLLYTDGLIERHDEPLDSSLDALLAAVDGFRAEAPEALAAALTRRLTATAAAPDDVCVLALRLGA